MSWFEANFTRRAAILGAFALASCGFQPVFRSANQEQLRALRGKIELSDATGQESYVIRNRLELYFGRPEAVTYYNVAIAYQTSAAGLAISQSSQAQRKRVTARGLVRVTNKITNDVILDRSFRRVAAYSVDSDRFAADQTLVETKERLAQTVADELAVQITAAIAADRNSP